MVCGNMIGNRSDNSKSNASIAWLMTALVCLLLAGCPRTRNSQEGQDTVAKPAETPAATFVLPAVSESPEQIRSQMATIAEPFSPQFEENRLKLTVVLDQIRKQQGVEGFQDRQSEPEFSNSPSAFVDTKSGRVGWRALTCWNPQCTGQGRGGGPLLFTREFSYVTAGPDGKLAIGNADMAEMMKPVYCPACRSDKYIRPYELPESMVKERELKVQLDRSYAAYASAAKQGRPMPTDVRSPEEIIKDLNSLPKLYLVSEPGMVKEYDAVTAPISMGGGR